MMTAELRGAGGAAPSQTIAKRRRYGVGGGIL